MYAHEELHIKLESMLAHLLKIDSKFREFLSMCWFKSKKKKTNESRSTKQVFVLPKLKIGFSSLHHGTNSSTLDLQVE